MMVAFQHFKLLAIIAVLPALCHGRCKEDEHQCSNDGYCISKARLCDAIKDCNDGSDETTSLCQFRSCSERLDFVGSEMEVLAVSHRGDFQCNYGACISSHFTCDGISNCIDGSDETPELCGGTRCSGRQLQCNYGACISKIRKCNGKVDCADGSDETEALCTGRGARVCRKNYFRCSYGACIYYRRKCDGKVDCADESDEQPSVCGPDHKYTPSARIIPAIPSGVPRQTTTTTTTTEISNKNSNSGGSKIEDILSIVFGGGSKDPEDLLPEVIKVIEGERGNGVVKDEPRPAEPPVTSKPPKPESTTVGTTEKSSFCTMGECQCPSPLDFLCIPCDISMDVALVCSQIGNSNLCSKEVKKEDSFDILYCGPKFEANVHMFNREVSQCGDAFGVPVLTKVFALCWRTVPIVATCGPEGSWITPEGDVMDRLCQPENINSKICGNFPVVKRQKKITPYDLPFLVGLLFDNRFACTGTIIASRWVLTAAHCLTQTRGDVQETTNLDRLSIQYALSASTNVNLKVSNIYLSPNFTVHPVWSSDIALIQLQDAIEFSENVFPACLDTDENLFGKLAATFIRGEGVEEFLWEMSIEKLDVSCFNRESRCTRHIQLGTNEFCSSSISIKQEGATLVPGSSGGPYLVNTGNEAIERWSVAAVVSRATGSRNCAFVVHSYVHSHLPWIRNCVQNNFC